MSYYAKIDSNNIVVKVMASDSDYMNNKFVDDSPGTWIQTSYTGSIRGNFAGIGYTYMKNVSTLGVGSTDIFIEQQPYPSWNVGVNTAEWYPPVGLATVSKDYYWDEPTTSWLIG
tara:strand:- start:44 stop:388 length:345 start_codon:yes stop_codon:yes gene_type:complete